jgi:hypothetical protein
MLLQFIDEVSPGIARYRLDLGELYPGSGVRVQFEARWREFVESTADHDSLFARDAEPTSWPAGMNRHSLWESTSSSRFPARQACLRGQASVAL